MLVCVVIICLCNFLCVLNKLAILFAMVPLKKKKKKKKIC